jgi:hypothetical protein
MELSIKVREGYFFKKVEKAALEKLKAIQEK